MRHWTKLIVMTSALLAFTSPAWADDHGDDPTPCASDADCGEYEVCAEGDSGKSDEDLTTSVSTSSDETEEEAADMEILPSCESDEDCDGGDWVCIDNYCTYADSEAPAEPVEVDDSDEPSMVCLVDLSAIPAAPACASLCDVMASCGGLTGSSSDSSMGSDGADASSSSGFTPEEGEGSGDEDGAEDMPSAEVSQETCEIASDCANEDAECIDGLCSTEWDHSEMEPGESEPIEMSPEAIEEATKWCIQICSYGVYMEVGLDELASLNACIEGTDTETLCAEESCGDEGEAWVEALDASGVMEGIESSVGGASMGAAESGFASDADLESSMDDSSATGSGTSGDEAATDDGAEEAEGDGGCNASDAPLMPWAVVLGLMTVVFLRRREAL